MRSGNYKIRGNGTVGIYVLREIQGPRAGSRRKPSVSRGGRESSYGVLGEGSKNLALRCFLFCFVFWLWEAITGTSARLLPCLLLLGVSPAPHPSYERRQWVNVVGFFNEQTSWA